MYSRDGGGHRESGEAGGDGSGELNFEQLYQDIALSCFRYLGFTSFEQVDELTIPEYNLLMKAAQLRQVDEQYRLHWQAYLNQAVKAPKSRKSTKPKYAKFETFFDYEKAQRTVLGQEPQTGEPSDRFAALRAHLRKEEKADA